MWYPTSMLQWPYCTSCQSTRPGRPSASRNVLPTCVSPWMTVHPGPGVRDASTRTRRRAPAGRARRRARRPRCGPSKLRTDLLHAAHLQRDRRPGREPRRVGDVGVLPRVRVQPRELAECRRGLVDRARRQRVEEHTAGLDDVLGDHDAVPRLRMDVGPHAAERAHTGGVRRGRGRSSPPAHRPACWNGPAPRSTPWRTARATVPAGLGVALDVEPGVGRHAARRRARASPP